MTNIKQLIEEIDEKRSAQPKGEWTSVESKSPSVIMDGDHELWDIVSTEYFVLLHNSYDQLRKAALAGSELAREIKLDREEDMCMEVRSALKSH